jgi:transcriptional regulator with XRE-family HTH domain
MTIQQVSKLRAKKVGVLLRSARQAAGKSLEECAAQIGVSPETLEAYEYGNQAPSLPELEALAYILDTPLSRFYEDGAQEKPAKSRPEVNLPQVVRLRHRMVGAMIRKYRMDTLASSEALAEKAGVTVAELQAFELGERPIPLPVLEQVARALGRPVKDFQDRKGPVGNWVMQQQVLKDFLELPFELQEFIGKPINRPYLELAQRLSEMPVHKLRSIAEGLLEITL